MVRVRLRRAGQVRAVLTAETDPSAAVVRRPADGQGRTASMELAALQ